MASKLLNLVALSSLAILACSFGAQPANALSHGHLEHLSNRAMAHAPLAKKKRDNKRCKARPSSSSAPPATTSHSSSVKPQAAAVTTTKAPAPPTTTKAAAPATTTAASTSTGSGAVGNGKFGQKGSKICLAWGDGNDPSLSQFKTDHVVGLYDWGVSKPSDADKLGFDYWGMLWGGDQARIDAFEAATQGSPMGSILLGFNEPNESGQSNMDPTVAAQLYKKHLTPKADLGYKLATPAMSSRPNGHQWMQTFMAACQDCKISYQAVHWYDIGFPALQAYLTQYHNEIGLPIMLTEFADQNFNNPQAQASASEIAQFMSQALAFIDNTDWMVAGCPFGVMHDLQGVNTLNLLQNQDGSPTALGWQVINDSY
ncbi:glycosyl hydrolase catalytic core-domain-containing protein [Lenzites betulinus]|nr:glycosyl hydrolase catalytic core-domain-containing protein [Lenzites betulinus]